LYRRISFVQTIQETVMPQQTPAAGNPPGVVTVNGAPLTTPQAVYQAFKAQRRELGRQMDELQSTRENLSAQLKDPQVTGADRKGLETHMGDVDTQIGSLQKQMADADAAVAKAAGVPGATIDPPEPPRTGVPDEAWVLGGMFIVIVFLPLSIAYARRIWKRGGQVIAALPKEIADRLARVEQTVEATAIEVERIGEGQRFMTKVLTEHSPSALASGVGQPVLAQSNIPGEQRR
jgi:hypothetical protein